MQIVNIDSKICDLLSNDPTLITVINRFGITLGVGDKSIARICEEKNIDKTFLTTILNTFISEDYFPQEVLSAFSAEQIIGYLNKTNAYYEHYQIPNIERHFNFLIAKSSPENSSLAIIYKFFSEVKAELLNRINDDRTTLFPTIQQLESQNGDKEIEIKQNCLSHEDSIEDKISDLLNMLIMHISGNYDSNLAHAVIFALYGLKKDIKQNNRIRERILYPLYESLLK